MGLLGSTLKGVGKVTWGATKLTAKGTAVVVGSSIRHRRNKKLIKLAGEEIRNSMSEIQPTRTVIKMHTTKSPVEELKELNKLYKQKVITKKEFLESKRKILSKI